jgi:hypothetical protein
MWTHLNAFCSIPHIDWTLCCWSAILVDTLGCIPLCTTHGLDILLLICNTCGHPWMYSALYYTWVGHSVVDLQYLWKSLDVFCSVLHMDWTFCCWSAILVDILGCILLCTSHGLNILLLIRNTCVDTFGCILLCTSHGLDILLLICNSCVDTFGCIPLCTSHGLDILLLIYNTCVDTVGCITLCTSHGLDILLLICNTCGHPWMYSALYFTWVGHSVVDLQYLWISLDVFCSVLHMGWTFCCWSAILVDNFGCILLCTSHGLNILLLICNTCGHSWMHSALYFTWAEHSVVDLQYLWTPLDVFRSVLHMGWTFRCWSAILVDTIECILPCTSHEMDIVLLIYNTCGHPWVHWSAIHVSTFGCILLCTSHSLDILLLICNGHIWMHSALYLT